MNDFEYTLKHGIPEIPGPGPDPDPEAPLLEVLSGKERGEALLQRGQHLPADDGRGSSTVFVLHVLASRLHIARVGSVHLNNDR